ncbi:DUF805 domain-containing protein [Loktanella agnita]|uniref:DUF805 domain-containing protein n=1 Tax=Loktanella agnita TaxID=287097 RepID=UPI00398700CE
MGPTQAIRTCLAKSFQFKGRASQAEFWWFAGALATVAFVFLWPFATILSTTTNDYIVSKTNAFTGETSQQFERHISWYFYKITWTPISIAITTAFYGLIAAATARRLHDVGSSAWFGLSMLLIGPASALLAILVTFTVWQFAPFLGVLSGLLLGILSWLAWLICPLILLILLTRPSEKGQTEYGPNPNEVPQ